LENFHLEDQEADEKQKLS